MFSLRFISAGTDYSTLTHMVSAPYLRRRFTLPAAADSATLTICGLGFYDLFVNGRRVTKGILAPYISNPDDILYYDSYDLAPYLVPGENVLGVVLGNGMLNCPGGQIWDFEKARYRSSPKLALSFEADSAGEHIAFEADEAFVTHPSPIFYDDLRVGEFYDATGNLPGWSCPGFDDSAWTRAIPAEPPRGETRLCTADPIVDRGDLSPVSIRKAKISLFPVCSPSLPIVEPEGVDAGPEGYLYDFGTSESGNIVLHIHGRKGQRIVIQYAEKLDENGDIDLRAMSFLPKALNHRDVYICGGEEETYTPVFTYHSFRYALVFGLDEGQATDRLLTFRLQSSRLQVIGGFTSSDPVLNALQTATVKSDISNFFYFPTDCPHREKNGWTADAALSTEQMLLNITPDTCYREWMRNIRKAQREDGALPGIVPTGGWGFEWGNGPAWDCVLTYIPYFMWKYHGDLDIVRENATAIFRYIRYILSRRDARGLIAIGLGDWCQSTVNGSGNFIAPLEVTDTILSCDICEKAEKIFRATGLTLEADFAHGAADAFRTAFRTHLIDFGTMTAAGDCQTSQAMAIYYGMFTPAESVEAFRVLLGMIERNDGLMDTGVLGGRVLFHVLSSHGRSDLAYDMISTTRYPSYGNWIARGATTLWESFRPEGERQDSYNHHFWGDISHWLIENPGGICIDPHDTDPDELLIRPRLIPALTHAEAGTRARAGFVSTAWKREGDDVILTISVPAACHGYITCDSGWKFGNGFATLPLSSGTYRLVRTTAPDSVRFPHDK